MSCNVFIEMRMVGSKQGNDVTQFMGKRGFLFVTATQNFDTLKHVKLEPKLLRI